MISVSVIPQTLCYAGIGRSSDFVLLAARLPGIRVFQWPVLIYIIYTRYMHCPKNGLTASGNVADSHCIPILALKPHSLREPNARAKVVFILQQSKQSHNKLHILEAHFTPHGKQRVSLLENCGFLVGKLEFSNRETLAPILSVKPVVKFLVTIERQVFLEASATQGIEHHFLLNRRESDNTPTAIEIASPAEVYYKH